MHGINNGRSTKYFYIYAYILEEVQSTYSNIYAYIYIKSGTILYLTALIAMQ